MSYGRRAVRFTYVRGIKIENPEQTKRSKARDARAERVRAKSEKKSS